MKKSVFMDCTIFFIFYIFSGILSILFGMERQLDTRNYHIYNPFAFLNGRLNLDILPASKESYFNPLMDIPYYLAIQHLNDYPTLVTFIMGGSYALFLFMIYKIAQFIFRDFYQRTLTSFSVMMAGSIGLVVDQIGSLSHDIFIADLMLIVLYFFLKSFKRKYDPKKFVIPGLIAGIALGFKFTALIYIIPLIGTYLLFYKSFQNPIKTLFFFGIGGMIGFIITDGWWLYKVWNVYQNPLFPYFNTVFQSPYSIQKNTFSGSFNRHIPHELIKVWFYPFFFDFDMQLKGIILLFITNLFVLPFLNIRKFKEKYRIDLGHIDFMLIFSFLSFAFWVNTFGVPRYLAPVLGLFGMISVAILMKVLFLIEANLSHWKKFLYMDFSEISFRILCLFIALILSNAFIGLKNYQQRVWRIPIQNKLLFVEDMHIPDEAIVLTGVGVGILIPFQNPKAFYIKNTNMYSKQVIEAIRKKIEVVPDKVYLLSEIDGSFYASQPPEKIKEIIGNINFSREKKKIEKGVSSLKRLSEFGIDSKDIKCQQIKNNFVWNRKREAFYLCKLKVQNSVKK